MDNVMPVAILYRANHLLEEPSRLILAHLLSARFPSRVAHPSLALCHDVVEQFLAGILHHHDHVGRRGDHLVSTREPSSRWVHLQLDDVRMPQHLEVLDLALDPRVHVGRGDLGPVDELERDLVTGHSVRRD